MLTLKKERKFPFNGGWLHCSVELLHMWFESQNMSVPITYRQMSFKS
jgi:hypothetical protein